MMKFIRHYKIAIPVAIVAIVIFSCFILFSSCNGNTADADIANTAVSAADILPDKTELNAEEVTEYTSEDMLTESVVVTDIADWDKLEISKEDNRYRYIDAFLSGDTATLEELIWLPYSSASGVYDEYNTLKLDGSYSITKETDPQYGNTNIWLHFIVTESKVEYFPIGEYSFIVEDGMWGTYFRDLEYEKNSLSLVPKSGAYDAVIHWLRYSFGGYYLIPDYTSLSGESLENFNRFTAEYIFSAFTDKVGEDKWTPEVLQFYVQKYFGIENFDAGSYPTENGVYDLGYMAHGLHSWIMNPVGDTTDGDITTVTIQFFAEPFRTIKSHVVEYKLQYLDGGYKFLSSEIINKAKYEPAQYQS